MSRARALQLVGQAFSEIEEISRLMSFHDPESELSGLNRAPVGDWIRISPALGRVLRAALRLQRESRGWYNVAVGGPLVSARLLPGVPERTRWKDLRGIAFEVRGGRARRLKPVLLDLGGIAKGYAVDRAVAALRAHASGVVNAGGDLRAFGETAQSIVIRAGREQSAPFEIRNRAVATSSIAPLKGIKRSVSPYVDLRRRRYAARPKTAFVIARSCMMADALTKVALLAPKHVASAAAKRARAEIGVLE